MKLNATVEIKLFIRCDCVDWKPNVEILKGIHDLAFSYGLDYDGKVWDWCPWCGCKLKEDKDES